MLPHNVYGERARQRDNPEQIGEYQEQSNWKWSIGYKEMVSI